MGPAGGVGGIGDRLPPAASHQILDDAVVSPVGAIFPMPNGGTQAFAAGDEVDPGPIQRGTGAPGPALYPSERVGHPAVAGGEDSEFRGATQKGVQPGPQQT